MNITNKPPKYYIISAGESTVLVGNHAHASIQINDIEINETLYMYNGGIFTFTVLPNEGYRVDKVMINDIQLVSTDNVYTFKVAGDAVITVIAIDASLASQSFATYDIKFDLGERKTSKEITAKEELFATFELSNKASMVLLHRLAN